MRCHFILEHPLTASSWNDKLMKTDGVQVLEIDQFEYCLNSSDGIGCVSARMTDEVSSLSVAAAALSRRLWRGTRSTDVQMGQQ